MSDTSWQVLSNQAVSAAGVLYFLALVAHLIEWSGLRQVPVAADARVAVPVGAATAPRDPSSTSDADSRPAR